MVSSERRKEGSPWWWYLFFPHFVMSKKITSRNYTTNLLNFFVDFFVPPEEMKSIMPPVRTGEHYTPLRASPPVAKK
jgi:hypothetical protein